MLFSLAQIWREVQSSFHCSELEDFTLSPHDAVAEPSRPWPVSQPGVSCADGFLNHSLLSIKKVTFVIAAISALCTDSFKAHSQKGIHHCALMLLWLFFFVARQGELEGSAVRL